MMIYMSDIDEEFLPLPHYSWAVRPSHLALDIEECATALYLSKGVVSVAAERLKVESLKLQRVINRSPRLVRLHAELVALLNDDVHKEVIAAFADDDSRRREWASAKVIGSKQFQSHPLAPNNQNNPQISIGGPTRIIISWDDGSVDNSPTDADGQSGKLIEGEIARRGSSDSGSDGDV